MFIRDLVTADELPALEQSLRFSAQRQRVIAHNIANIDTPNFQPLDVSISGFRETLGRALEDREKAWGGKRGALELRETRELKRNDRGLLELRPSTEGDNILFHDRNNRDLERIMQDLAENTLAHNAGLELLKSEFDLLEMAIRGNP